MQSMWINQWKTKNWVGWTRPSHSMTSFVGWLMIFHPYIIWCHHQRKAWIDVLIGAYSVFWITEICALGSRTVTIFSWAIWVRRHLECNYWSLFTFGQQFRLVLTLWISKVFCFRLLMLLWKSVKISEVLNGVVCLFTEHAGLCATSTRKTRRWMGVWDRVREMRAFGRRTSDSCLWLWVWRIYNWMSSWGLPLSRFRVYGCENSSHVHQLVVC